MMIRDSGLLFGRKEVCSLINSPDRRKS